MACSLELTPAGSYYKLINKDMKNRDYTFKEGLNEHIGEYNAKTCEGGGLYFTNAESIPHWVSSLRFDKESLVFKVELPEHAKVVNSVHAQTAKWKTNALILSEPVNIVAFITSHKLECAIVKLLPKWITLFDMSEDFWFNAMKANPAVIIDAKIARVPLSQRMCFEAVRQDPLLLKYVDNQDFAICMSAVIANGLALEFVKAHFFTTQQYHNICFAAIEEDPMALEFAGYDDDEYAQTADMCFVAVRVDGMALRFVSPLGRYSIDRQEYEEICRVAFEQDPMSFRFIKEPSDSMCELAVRTRPDLLKYIEEQTPEICRVAVEADGMVLQYVKIIDPRYIHDIRLAAVRQNGLAMEFVRMSDRQEYEEICFAAIYQNGVAIEHIINPTRKMRQEVRERSW
jgi:hypothetical protein